MTVYTTEWTMTSDITPETAYRDLEGAAPDTWRLSWLSDRRLTRAQALAGMELDELFSDPDGVHDRMVQAQLDIRADQLGMLRDQALIRLAKSMAERLSSDLPDGPTPPGPNPCGPRSPHTGHSKHHVIDLPLEPPRATRVALSDS
ncbi:hypothetical protein [Nocardia callitridis]|uniref:DUF222 domain-containing protein n=1 Tax=Nocardia callitridis TaxID=648753 RepID=A0ABP9K6N7_9NOCA